MESPHVLHAVPVAVISAIGGFHLADGSQAPKLNRSVPETDSKAVRPIKHCKTDLFRQIVLTSATAVALPRLSGVTCSCATFSGGKIGVCCSLFEEW